MMKKILLTGGSGFIGRNIKESYLSSIYEIQAPNRAELDCSDEYSVRAYFKDKNFDVVIHSAAKPSHRNAIDRDHILEINSRMFFNLLHHQQSWGKLILIGSGAVYDMENYLPKMQESYFGTHIPKDAHGYTRYIIAKLLPALQNVFDLRVFGIYGKYEDYAIRFISNAICKTLFGLPITIKQDRLFDYLYIDDLMPVLEYFIENEPKEKAYNITPDQAISLYEIAQMVNSLAGEKNEIQLSNPSIGVEYSGSNELLKKEMKDLAFTPIEHGIGKLFHWYTENRVGIDKQKLLFDK